MQTHRFLVFGESVGVDASGDNRGGDRAFGRPFRSARDCFHLATKDKREQDKPKTDEKKPEPAVENVQAKPTMLLCSVLQAKHS